MRIVPQDCSGFLRPAGIRSGDLSWSPAFAWLECHPTRLRVARVVISPLAHRTASSSRPRSTEPPRIESRELRGIDAEIDKSQLEGRSGHTLAPIRSSGFAKLNPPASQLLVLSLSGTEVGLTRFDGLPAEAFVPGRMPIADSRRSAPGSSPSAHAARHVIMRPGYTQTCDHERQIRRSSLRERASLKERAGVKAGFAPYLFALRSVSGHAKWAPDPSGRPGPGVALFPVAAIPGGQVKDRRSPAVSAAPQASLRRPRAIC